MFGGHWSSVSGDLKYLICHVISRDHVIEGSSDIILTGLVALSIVVVEL